MKTRLIILMLFLGLAFQVNAQRSYEEKARSQKTTGFILLAGGAAMMTVALAADLSSDSPVWLTAGGLSALASIPFFVASSKNQKRASGMAANFELQKINSIAKINPNSTYPAIKFSLRL